MTALLDSALTPIVILLFALLIYAAIKYSGWSSPGGNTPRVIFRVAGGGGESNLFESASLPEERLF